MKRIIIAGLAAAASAALPVSAEEHRVTIRGMEFQPRVLEVAVGDTIVFANAGPTAHTATATNGAFDTGRIRSGEGVRLTITEVGTHDYVCAYHLSMQARIVAN